MIRAGALLAAIALAACGMQKEPLCIGAGTDEPAPSIISTVADSLRDAGFDVTVKFFEQTDDIFAGLANRSIDLALVEEPLARVGRETMLLPLYPVVLHALSSRNAPPSDFRELLERPIYAGLPGSVGYDLAQALAAHFSIADSRILEDPWRTEPDGYLIFGGLLSNDAIRQLEGFELFDLARDKQLPGESLVDAIALRYPNLHAFTVPADLYPELSHEPIHTLAVTTLLAARPELGDDTAYRVTRQLVENWRPIRTMYPLAGEIALGAIDYQGFVLPLHNGARRYLERDRPGFVERHIDVIALLTSLIMATASGALGWTHRRRRARKDRVDRHLTNVLAMRECVRTAELDGVVETIDRIEKEVLGLVVTEQIEADSGLIAFLMLCDSVRREIEGGAP
jgi:hypothetical protein